MKDEKYKPASKRQYKRLAQLVRLTGRYYSIGLSFHLNLVAGNGCRH